MAEKTPAKDSSALSGSIREAALVAMSEHDVPTFGDWSDEGTPAPEAASTGEEEPKEDSQQTPSAEEPVDGPEEPEEPEEPQEPEVPEGEEVPESYFGEDLSDLPPEARQRVIAMLKERDGQIQAVQRENATLRSQEVPEPEIEPEAEVTDEDLMKYLGYDPDDPLYEVKAEVALPLARGLLQTQAVVAEIQEERQVAAFEDHWNDTVTALETDNNLKVDRDALLDYALEHKIPDPRAAFSQYVLEGRATIQAAAAEERKKAQELLREKKKAAASTRPKDTSTSSKEPPKGLSPIEAARRASEDLGMDWGAALAASQ